MKKADIFPMPDYYDRYIQLVDDLTLNVAFDKYFTQIQNLNQDVLNELDGRTYAPEKWTIKEILQHLIDWERIFSYRAIIFARKENNIPPGHDENILAANSKANQRDLEEIIDDYLFARRNTQSLYNSFDQADLTAVGKSLNYEMPVLALGFIILGHQIHHFNIISERYLPLTSRHQPLILGKNGY